MPLAACVAASMAPLVSLPCSEPGGRGCRSPRSVTRPVACSRSAARREAHRQAILWALPASLAFSARSAVVAASTTLLRSLPRWSTPGRSGAAGGDFTAEFDGELSSGPAAVALAAANGRHAAHLAPRVAFPFLAVCKCSARMLRIDRTVLASTTFCASS